MFKSLKNYRTTEDAKRDQNTFKMYKMRYRIIKTLLMVCAWISLGVNQELARITLEDLRILLSTNYQGVSFTILMRFVGAMIIISFMGLIMDKFTKYSEILMAIGKALMIIPNFLIPCVRIYWLSTVLFFIQGCGIGMFDIGGNQMILRLWSGISNSPVNAMHAGYGIGAIIAVQILKPYIKFNPLLKASKTLTLKNHTTINETVVTSNDITLMVPYSIGGCVGIVIVILFLIAQYFEIKNTKSNSNKRLHDQIQPLKHEDTVIFSQSSRLNCSKMILKFIKEKVFSGQKDLPLSTSSLLAILICFLFMSANGYLTVLNTFMLTYLTKGPAKFNVASFIQLQTLYWINFIIGRFLAAILGFKMNSLIFFLILLLLELILTLFYAIPCLNSLFLMNSIQLFYWFIIPTMGVVVGPLVPSCYMIPKCIFKSFSAFLLSLFCIGTGVGNIFTQYITGVVLDTFQPTSYFPASAYYIPFILITIITFTFILYLCILSVYKASKKST